MKKTAAGLIVFVLSAVLSLMTLTAERGCAETASVYGDPVVILDAGHGGEDGGAIAPDGTNEKDINLQMTERVALLFDLIGVRYIAIREDDRLIGDNSLPSVRERKVSDIHERMSLVTKTPGAVLLSVHQNYFIKEQYSGTQVFYAPHAAGSAEMASFIQSAVVRMLQPDNTRQVKPTEGTVYLLDKAEKTSVMVECGFLSNPRELKQLQDPQYQSELAYCIVRGICDYFNNHTVS